MATVVSAAVATGAVRSSGGSKEFFECLFAALEHHSVQYCVLHSYESLPEAAVSDVDMALVPADLRLLPQVFELLEAAGYQMLQCLEYETGSYYFIFGWWNRTGLETVAIDFTVEHREGNLILRSGDHLTEGRIRYKSFWIPAPAMEFEYLYAKKVLKGSIGPAQATRLSALCEELGLSEACRVARRLFGMRNGSLAVELCVSGNIGREIPGLQRSLRATLHSRIPFPRLRYFLTDFRRRVRRIVRPTGTFVSVLGPDGSGKSTAIENILAATCSLYRDQAIFHWRPRLLFSGGGREPNNDPHAQEPYGWFRSIARALLHAADYQLGYCAYVRTRTTRSSLVVFDRYFDDMLVDPRRYRYGGPTWVLRLLRKVVPQPDLQIVLDAPVDVILSRKQEQGSAEVQRQRGAYRALPSEGRSVVVNGSGDAESVAAACLREIVGVLRSKLQAHHPQWLASSQAGQAQHESILRSFTSSAAGNTRPSREYLAVPNSRHPRWLLPLVGRAITPGAWSVYTPYSRKARLFKRLVERHSNAVHWMLGKVVDSVQCPLDLDVLAQEVTGQKDLHLTFSFGEPRATRKLTVQVMTNDGRVLGFIKVPLTSLARERVQHEARMLFSLEAHPELSGQVPKLVFGGLWRGEYVLFQSAVSGVSGVPTLTEGHCQLLEKLGRIGATNTDGSAVAGEVRDVWNEVKLKATFSDRAVVENILRNASAQLVGVAVECGLSHGDFAPWNIRMQDGRICLFDWEAARAGAPRVWDRFHFLTQCSTLLGQDAVLAGVMAPVDQALFALYLVHSVSEQLLESPSGVGVSMRMKLLRTLHSAYVTTEVL